MACCRYWELKLNSVKVGAETVGGLTSTGALLDSGTSLIFTSDKDAAALNAVGPTGSSSEAVSCAFYEWQRATMATAFVRQCQ